MRYNTVINLETPQKLKYTCEKWGQNTKAVINKSNVRDAAVVHLSVLAELHVDNKHFLLVKRSVFRNTFQEMINLTEMSSLHIKV